MHGEKKELYSVCWAPHTVASGNNFYSLCFHTRVYAMSAVRTPRTYISDLHVNTYTFALTLINNPFTEKKRRNDKQKKKIATRKNNWHLKSFKQVYIAKNHAPWKRKGTDLNTI